ncbi:TerB family tellurite resistance protein [Robiginitalea sp. M366]|uniref:TerB family tellurite resistance protein n=1 Tax=Robiginitalea aestuariiviva TaxID=3036903 RepID=UPI00240DE532|nr:TerB family tellurite resistance protein [Robiginitalea aestuariiviva]MDG1571207.1 TerB family tellurite resistance protein [Robiginitalea aestuariiviva]
MPILDLYNHSEKRRNLAHFAALASLAAVDGAITPPEKEVIDRFASKLNITPEEYKEVMKKENQYPIEAPFEMEQRYERLFDFFRIIFSDHQIDNEEMALVKKYALGIGFTHKKADEVIAKSVAIFTGRIPFEDYLYLIQKEH